MPCGRPVGASRTVATWSAGAVRGLHSPCLSPTWPNTQVRLRSSTLVAIRRFAAEYKIKEPKSILDAGCSGEGGIQGLLFGTRAGFLSAEGPKEHPPCLSLWLLVEWAMRARCPGGGGARPLTGSPLCPCCSGYLHAVAGGRVPLCPGE